MLCQVCKKSEATVHYTELSSNKFLEMHLCEKCALEKGISVKPDFLLSDLLAGLVELGKTSTLEKELKCSNCGLTYKNFKSTGRLGCAKCYGTFKSSLRALLKKIHGIPSHTGKIPAVGYHEVDKTKISKTLRAKLQKLVEREEFEQAARLRDEIKKLEK